MALTNKDTLARRISILLIQHRFSLQLIFGETHGLTVGADANVIQQNRDYYLTAAAVQLHAAGLSLSAGWFGTINDQPSADHCAARQRCGCGRADCDVQRHRVRFRHFDLSIGIGMEPTSPGPTSSSWTTPPTVLGNSNSVVYVTDWECLWQRDLFYRLPLRDQWRRSGNYD